MGYSGLSCFGLIGWRCQLRGACWQEPSPLGTGFTYVQFQALFLSVSPDTRHPSGTFNLAALSLS
ncbi:hypothetical protein AG1IA_06572 [Rhizoctonia solani AG-1 IA]|uniref:Uncharacterized protein n=1 Tax=Thanatephorus cucumeris (strain AG1-IA) TaxID=983506 RepID=L8WSM6_THACA|nr:hypothetical protein AG1IA_06572 [Rhizoctonia solani AG-1 IA]